MLIEAVKIGAGVAASIGAGRVAKIAIAKVVTTEMSKDILIKVGTWALTGVAAGAAAKYTGKLIEDVVEGGKEYYTILKESIESLKKEESKKDEES